MRGQEYFAGAYGRGVTTHLATMRTEYKRWSSSVDASLAGLDYPEKRVAPDHPKPQRRWPLMSEYAPYLAELSKDANYKKHIEKVTKGGVK